MQVQIRQADDTAFQSGKVDMRACLLHCTIMEDLGSSVIAQAIKARSEFYLGLIRRRSIRNEFQYEVHRSNTTS